MRQKANFLVEVGCLVTFTSCSSEWKKCTHYYTTEEDLREKLRFHSIHDKYCMFKKVEKIPNTSISSFSSIKEARKCCLLPLC